MQKNVIYVLLWVLMMGAGYSVKAQSSTDTLRLSLSEAIKLGVKNNLNLQNSNLDYQIAQKKVWEVTALGLPQVTATGKYTYLPTVAEIKFGDGPGIPTGLTHSKSVDVVASQLIFSGEWLVGLQAASVYKMLEKKLYAKSTDQTIESITNAYNAVLITREAARNLDSTLAVIKKLYEEVKAYNAEGLNEETDVDQLKISVNNLQSGVETLKGQLNTLDLLLKIQLGLELNQPLVLTNSINDLVALAPLQSIMVENFDVTQSVDYQLAQSQQKIAKLSVNREYTKFLPTLAGFYAYHKNLNNFSLDFQAANTFGLTLSIPLITGGARLSTLSQAKLGYVKSQNSYKLAEQGLITQFAAVRNAYLSAYNTYLNAKESMELSLRVYNKDVIKYKEGMVSSIDLTTSQNQYLASQKTYYMSQQALLTEKASLERILTKSAN